jgi:hypothetical protein
MRFGWLAVGLLLFAGCFKPSPTVSGMVRWNGEPLAKGSIRFVPVDRTPGSDAGGTIKEGKYTIEKGLTVGKYRVELKATKKTGKKARNPVLPADMIDEEIELIPPEYNENSQLTREVGPGLNPIDFDLPSGRVPK